MTYQYDVLVELSWQDKIDLFLCYCVHQKSNMDYPGIKTNSVQQDAVRPTASQYIFPLHVEEAHIEYSTCIYIYRLTSFPPHISGVLFAVFFSFCR
jgi:hypothetical protein